MTVLSAHRSECEALTKRWQIAQAARVVNAGGVIAYPTEAVYGLGCDPCDGAAVLRLLAIKQRRPDKGLILIAADIDALQPYLMPITAPVREKLLRSWPGPVTWLLPARVEVPFWLCGAHRVLAVRVTAHPLAAALCRAAGGVLVSTSANVTRRAPARTALAVRSRFGVAIDYVLSGAVGDQDKPTPIYDAVTGRVVRAP